MTFMIPVIIIGAISHRIGLIDTPTVLAVLGVGWTGCALGLGLGLLGIMRIWSLGIEGLHYAVTGVLLAIPVLALPLYFVWLLVTEPRINDVSTDLLRPPGFDEVVRLRPPGANSTQYPGTATALLQRQAHPEIRPFRTGLGTEDTYQSVLLVAQEFGWDIVFDFAPPDGDSPGRIEAVASTLLLGFKDDVVIRVAPDEGGSRVDIRSASRYGKHDFGANAARVRDFLFALREAVAPTAGGER